MDTGVNPTKSTDKNRTLHSEGTGVIDIGLDQGLARHLGFPQSPRPPPTGPVPPPPTSSAKTTPEKAQYPTPIKDPVGKILGTTFYRVKGDLKTLTNLYHSGRKGELDKNTGQPYKTAVEALLKAKKPYELKLNEDDENKLMTHMQWEFLCDDCGETKPAFKFPACSWKFWVNENEAGGDVFLHSEECKLCFDKKWKPISDLLKQNSIS